MLQRPQEHLDSLSMKLKGETTRRHPIYLWLWETWEVFHRNFGDQAETQFLDFAGCQWAWLMLGVNGIPTDPATDFDSFTADTDHPIWLKRSARPATYRLLAQILLSKLGADGLKVLSTLLFNASKTEKDTEERNRKLLMLSSCDWREFDDLVDFPLLIYNPRAPSKEFQSDLTKLRIEARESLGLQERRINEEKLLGYLNVWDLREGWSAGRYDRNAGQSIASIAQKPGPETRNAKYAYRQAFELISGHSYSFDHWLRLMGLVHFSVLFGDQVNPLSHRRLRQSATLRGIDDTTLSDDHQSVLQNLSGGQVDLDTAGLIERIRGLVCEGKADAEILGELELEENALPAIEAIRQALELETD